MTLRLTFLGTGGAVPTTERNTSALCCNRDGDRLLFDVGEGTQRQMMRFNTGFAVSDVFVTHLHGDHVLGLPGLIQTWGFNDRTAPLAVHVPPGTADDVWNLLRAADTDPAFPVDVREVTPGDVVHRAEAYEVRAVRAAHTASAVGYVLDEAERKGRFDRERAEALGVPPGPKFSTLHEGEPVELDDGTVVVPDQVVGPPRPGRRVVYTGDTRPTDAVIDAAAGADLLVHDATFAADAAERARETGHATAREAGEVAAEAGASRLALTHLSSRYTGEAGRLRREAAQVFDGEVLVPDDGDVLEVPLPA